MFLNMKRLSFAFLCCFFILTGCSDNTEGTKPKEEVKETQGKVEDEEQTTDVVEVEETVLDSPALPTNLEEIIAYPVGQFSADETKVEDEAVQKELEAIPVFPEDATDEELTSLFEHLYSLFKKEYTDPKQVMTGNIVTEPGQSGEAVQQAETFNVEVILDSSGSMANLMGSKTRMELAKESINKFASSLPKEANISLRVYGHKGTGTDNDKGLSCSSNELIYPMQPYNQAGLDQVLSNLKPAGWTPLAQAITEAQKDLSQYKGEHNKNIIYVVSDGIETCGGDPVAAAKSLKDSGISPVVNIIGFDLAGKDQQQLQDVAKAAGGTYTNVQNQGQLQDEFNKTIEESAKWLKWSTEQSLGALNQSSGQIMDIYEIGNTWHANNSKEEYLIHFSLVNLQSKNKINSDQNNKINDMMNAFYREQTQSVDQLETVLVNSTNEDLSATLEKIDQIYQENVSQD
ncbi:VWA domain-containing protein [Robertmurraya sp. GLU-23]